MLTIEEKIARSEYFAKLYEQAGISEWQEECEQLAAWLRELAERRKADSCEGCVYEEGSFLRCMKCKRYKKYYDRYEPGRRTE